jgi:hypothetical protein
VNRQVFAVSRPPNVIRRYISIAAAIDMLRHSQLALLDPGTWDDRNDRYFMDLYKEGKGLGGLYAACAATCFETYHHWRVFTSSADGVCVEIFRQPLEQELATLSGVRFGEVEYLRLDEVEKLTSRNLDDLPFLKRVAFEPEQEYRIIVERSEPQQPAIWLEMPIEWIGRILLNPWLPERVARSVRATLKEIEGCGHLTVERSHMIENARWKRAGEAVIGGSPATARLLRRNRTR